VSADYCPNCVERCETMHDPCLISTDSCVVICTEYDDEVQPFTVSGVELGLSGESTSARLRRVEQERDEMLGLLAYALHLRQHGERAPGGDETWAEFDRRCEAFLRQVGGIS
jgi:hypothetical protein